MSEIRQHPEKYKTNTFVQAVLRRKSEEIFSDIRLYCVYVDPIGDPIVSIDDFDSSKHRINIIQTSRNSVCKINSLINSEMQDPVVRAFENLIICMYDPHLDLTPYKRLDQPLTVDFKPRTFDQLRKKVVFPMFATSQASAPKRKSSRTPRTVKAKGRKITDFFSKVEEEDEGEQYLF